MLDTTYHKRRLHRRLQDAEFRHAYELERQKIDQVDTIIRQIDELRARSKMSKAELARRIGKHPAVVRRLLTSQSNPEFQTVVAMATVLEAKVSLEMPAVKVPA